MKRFRGLRGKRRACFEQIATGRMTTHHPRTLASLANDELIKFEKKRFALEGFGTLTVDVPYVPEDVHQAWCQWCADHRRKCGIMIGGNDETINQAS